jgi:hypothetical protein
MRVIGILALGATTTIAIAWLCALFSSPIENVDLTRGYDVRRSATAEPRWYFMRVDSFGSTDFAASAPLYEANGGDEFPIDESRIPSWSLIHSRPASMVVNGENGWPRGQVEMARGWPLRALRTHRDAKHSRGFDWMCILTPETTGPWRGGVQFQWWPPRGFDVWSAGGRVLPLEPLPVGFAVNTALFALAWWVVVAAPSRLRRSIRIRRGLCAGCGYNLAAGGQTVCPECGAG